MAKTADSMHYAPYHISTKQLKLWAATAHTPEARKQFVAMITKRATRTAPRSAAKK